MGNWPESMRSSPTHPTKPGAAVAVGMISSRGRTLCGDFRLFQVRGERVSFGAGEIAVAQDAMICSQHGGGPSDRLREAGSDKNTYC